MKNGYNSTKKRLLAIIMSLAMIFQMLPAGALADGQHVSSAPLRISNGTYCISFEGRDEEILVPAGNMIGIEAPAAPSKPEGVNATFLGWYCEEESEWFSKTYTPKADMVFTAKYGWEVRFRNYLGDVIDTRTVVDGEAIGDLPEVPAREDWTDGFWGVGVQTHTEQGDEWKAGIRVNKEKKVNEDMDLVAGYTKITYTVKFYTDENKTDLLAEETVDADTNYCLNDVPAVPVYTGSSGKWVYQGGDYNNMVKITADTDVWAVYDKNVFTVTFMVDDEEYEKDIYYTGDALTLPNDPVVEGKDFIKWIDEDGNEVAAGESVTHDMTITAEFKTNYFVNFVVLDEDGAESERLSQYFRSSGEAIGTMPQDPFVAGKVFVKWVIKDTDTEVDASTVVKANMTVVALFRDVTVYTIRTEYYYLNDDGEEFTFNVDVMDVEADELPYTITAPSTTQTIEEQVAGGPVYYPRTPTKTVELREFDTDKKCTVKFEYVEHTAEYDFVYLLKNLTGNGYTEIERTSDVHGVLGSYVTPTVKTYDYANLERAVGADITQAEGQELNVYYTRKNYQLTYETNGGSYVGGVTVPYETIQPVTSTVPTRTGYTFAGWYKDAALTQSAGDTVEVKKDTTLYAKWTGKTVNYTIVYMIEKYDDTGTESSFVYGNSTTRTGTVGSPVTASSAPNLTGDNAKYREKDTVRNAASSIVIEADGSSVLFVYYKLKEYTFRFRPGVYHSNNALVNKNWTLISKKSDNR